jgi:hypothetical protein
MGKKRGRTINIKINFSNRWLYTFITLGILAIVGVGVWAVDTSKAWHSSNQIEFTDESVPATALQSGIPSSKISGNIPSTQISFSSGSVPYSAVTHRRAIYQYSSACGGGIGFSSSCSTVLCDSSGHYYDCCRACSRTRPQTCSNTACIGSTNPVNFMGYLV